MSVFISPYNPAIPALRTEREISLQAVWIAFIKTTKSASLECVLLTELELCKWSVKCKVLSVKL